MEFSRFRLPSTRREVVMKLEDMILITQDGCEVFNKSGYDLVEV